MASESTPLIQTIRVRPVRRRPTGSTLRRFFFIAISCTILYVVFVVAFQILAWPYHHRPRHDGRFSYPHKHGRGLSHEQLRKIMLDTPKAELAREWNKYYASGMHLAGKNFSQADWTREKWQSWGVDASIATYDTYLNYPLDHSLELWKTSAKKPSFVASLKEDVLDEDPTTSDKNSVPTFHGYSASGDARAQFVYVNYGTYQDYQDLTDAGIDLKGKVAIARYGGIFRGLKVKRAQELGMIGILIYSDPGDDGEITEENGYKAYPNGPARNPSSVQRGSVQFLSSRPGDPTTPGYPSKPGVPRAPTDDSMPKIPSIPISYADALPFLKALNGHGPNVTDFGKYWQTNLGLRYKGVHYNIGPSPADVVLDMSNKQEYTITPQWDVIGIVNGTIPNEVVIIGNHRDAWVVGGASDPNSGSAIMNEVVRSVGEALDAGWKPLRTIVFASWDGEEYGLVGSTEWVEEYLPWLTDANVAYVNVDGGAGGPDFGASAAPLLHKVVRDATKLIPSPNQTVAGQTIADLWSGKISTIGSGSDFTAFQDYAGVPSIDLSFKSGGPKSPVYHYHSNYDSFYWMNKYGDPGYVYHEAMAKLIGSIIVTLSEEIVIPFRAKDYAKGLLQYLDQVDAKLSHAVSDKPNELPDDADEEDVFALRASPKRHGKVKTHELASFQAGLERLRRSLERFSKASSRLDKDADHIRTKLEEGFPWWNIVGKIRFAWTLVHVNKEYKQLERHFLYQEGLDNRNWFKHVVYAPGKWTGYAGAVYPGLMESIDEEDYDNGLRWTGIIRDCVESALKSLKSN